MAAVGTQVVLDALLVADVDEDLAEDASPGAVGQGNGQSALQHVLQQANSLEADTLAACIRSADDEDALPPGQRDAERHNLRRTL